MEKKSLFSKYIDKADSFSKRLPPILIIPFNIIAFIGFGFFSIYHGFSWLIGYYDCSVCKKRLHVFTVPRGFKENDFDVCRKCAPAPME